MLGMAGLSGCGIFVSKDHLKKHDVWYSLLKACKMPGEVASLTRDHVIDWVKRYGKAWQEQSVKGILELFTEAGTKLELVTEVVFPCPLSMT
jgi:hypothetical protein